jgi:hypothetical protein
VAQALGPEFKPQYRKKKKKNIESSLCKAQNINVKTFNKQCYIYTNSQGSCRGQREEQGSPPRQTEFKAHGGQEETLCSPGAVEGGGADLPTYRAQQRRYTDKW